MFTTTVACIHGESFTVTGEVDQDTVYWCESTPDNTGGDFYPCTCTPRHVQDLGIAQQESEWLEGLKARGSRAT